MKHSDDLKTKTRAKSAGRSVREHGVQISYLRVCKCFGIDVNRTNQAKSDAYSSSVDYFPYEMLFKKKKKISKKQKMDRISMMCRK